jgi:hypothetical protein
MVLIGVLLVALVCLILGLVLASGPWLVGSLVASAVAGFVLWRQRERIGQRSTAASTPAPATASRQTSLVTGTAFAGKTGTSAPARAAAPTADVAAASPAVAADTEVWVVDGLPHFHSQTCGQLAGKDAEAVPFGQAMEDGFVECASCSPVVGGVVSQVWVLEGRPDYHSEGCPRIAHADADQVPRAQAVADGLTACDVCHPDRAVLADVPDEPPAAEPPAQPVAEAAAAPATEPVAAPEPVAPRLTSAGDVWVVDGRPRYHLQNCMIIKDQRAEPIPLVQATEDGFMPCSMCEPNVTRV